MHNKPLCYCAASHQPPECRPRLLGSLVHCSHTHLSDNSPTAISHWQWPLPAVSWGHRKDFYLESRHPERTRLPSRVAGRLPAGRHILCSLEADGNQEQTEGHIRQSWRMPLLHGPVACACSLLEAIPSPRCSVTLKEKGEGPRNIAGT